MKKILVLFILCAYIWSATGFNELSKINKLSCHFAETSKLDGSISFYDFLVMHYFTDDHNSMDNDRDSELPFKSVTVCFSTLLISVLPYSISLFTRSFVLSKNEFFVEDDSRTLTNYQALVWHPPKFS